MDKVEQQVNDVLRRYCWCDSPEREQRLKDDLGIDSLRLVEVLVALEEEFGVTLKAVSYTHLDVYKRQPL